MVKSFVEEETFFSTCLGSFHQSKNQIDVRQIYQEKKTQFQFHTYKIGMGQTSDWSRLFTYLFRKESIICEDLTQKGGLAWGSKLMKYKVCLYSFLFLKFPILGGEDVLHPPGIGRVPPHRSFISCFLENTGGHSVVLVLADSDVTLIQNNQYITWAYLGAACPKPHQPFDRLSLYYR